MAQDAELKLKVSLDLAFFRQQLSTIGTQLGGQSIQLNIQFDRQAIANQYRLLDNALSRRVFKVKIESPTLDKLAEKVSTFKKNLAALGDEKIDLAVSVVSNIDEIRKSIKSKLPSVQIQTELAEPTNVDDFIREVGKKVKGQVEKSYTGGGIPIATKLETPGTTNLIKALQKNFNNQDPLRAKVSTTPSIVGEDVKAFRNAVKEKFSGIVVKIKAELEGAGQGASGQETRNFSQAALRKLGQDIKPLYRAAADAGLVEFNESIANNIQSIARELSSISGDLIEGLLNGLKSKDPQVKAAAKSLGQVLISSIKGILGIASPSKVFKAIGDDVGKGFELGAVASMDKAFDALEQKLQERLRKLQSMLSLAPSRRSAFPFVAMGGAPESGPIAREIDQAYAQIAQIQERRQGRLAVQRGGLAQMAGRLLPPARDRSLPAARETIIPGGGALDQVTKGFVQSLRDTRDTLARNFSANTYLPKATRALATSMNVATKQLSGTKIAGLLPSKEMMEPLRFQRAQQRAAQIDAENIARQQAQKALDQANLRAMFQGTPRINAPRVGQEETAIGRHIQNKIEQAIRNARQTLGLPLGPSSPYVANPFAGAATVPPRQYFQAGGQAALPPARGTGPFAGGTGTPTAGIRPQSSFAAWSQQMTARYGGSGNVPPINPPSGPPVNPPSAPPSQPPGGGGGGRGGFGGFGGLGGFGRAIGGVNLPGAGTIRELGSEFAFATKQVLLFGQAYKLLGFLQSFPGQVGAAVGQLQTFRNTLGAISPTAEEAAASNKLILDLVERYNVPLQSAREGFTKLYASMAPAGFSGDEIRDLFTGITQAAATFGMSADKVDRVNYAFAQMASKGQVMSEELKGQLGDVLPGAMALFAKAAGFEGPKAIQDFSAALEDGAYKGEAMVALLKNVGIVMKQEFGPGAEGAALTFQGIINRMQNSMVLLYESFEPVAVSFLNAVVVPLTSGIQQISDGFTAFFAGVTAQTSGGFAIAQELERLRPTFNGLRENLSGLTEQLGQFARIALDVGKVFLQIASSPIVGYLAKLYAIALPINMALNVMRGLWAANALQLVIFNARVAAGTGTLTAFRGMMAATGATAQSTAASIRATGTVLRTFFAATGVGVVITGISMLIERIMMLNQKMDETRQKATGAANAIRMMSGTEALAAERSYAGYAKSLEGLNKQLQEGQLQGKAWIAVNRQQAEALKAAGVTPSEVRGQAQVQPTRISGAYQKLVQMQGEAAYRRRQLDFEASQIEQSAVLAPIPEATGGDAKEKSKKGARRSLAELVSAEVLMLADAEKAAIKYAEAQSRAMAPDTAQAQRMLDYYSKFRNNLVDMQAIQAQITIAEKNRGRWISEYGMTAEQIDGNIKELRNQLKIATIDLATTEQEYRNQAKKDAAEEAEEIQKKIEKQKELGRLIEDAQIAAGIISPQQAAILQQRRGFEDAQARVQQEGTPEQLAQLTAAQALIPEAGSLQETIKTLREELDKLTSSQELVKASALSIGDAFSKSFKDAITGASSAQEALAGFFQSVASSFADMAAQMIQKMIQIYILDQFLNILSPAKKIVPGVDVPVSQMPAGMAFANGGIAPGGFRAFANGGIVTGPTMGLVGEGRYNEAVVPLPDGKSIPVDLGKSTGDSGVNIVVNVDAKGTNVQGDNGMGRQLGAAVSAAVQAELIKQKRPGGLLA